MAKLTIPEKMAKKEAEIIELREHLQQLNIYLQQLRMNSPMEKEKIIEVNKQIKSVERRITTREYALYELQTKLTGQY